MLALWASLVEACEKLIWLSVVFLALSILVKRHRFLEHARRSQSEFRLNVIYYLIDAVAFAPLLVLLSNAVVSFVQTQGLALFAAADYEALPFAVTLLIAVALSDLVGYWRHRMMHHRWLWPVHAIHHSDREMTWLALARFHPINRVITMLISLVALSLAGLPAWAVVANGLIRHYYGLFIHADVPWTYGPLRYLFVSPVLHRWHHVRDERLSGTNFATIFSLYDVIFGTYALPKRAVDPLGIEAPDFPATWLGQTLYPFRVWLKGPEKAAVQPRLSVEAAP